MRARIPAWLGLLLAPALISAPGRGHAGEFDDAVLRELNQVRARPQAYARELRHEQVVQARYGEASGGMAQEDPEAVDDAIDFLMRQPPLPPLQRDSRLAAAAREYAARQGPSGEVGHGPPGSLGRRLQRQQLFAGIEAESISYGQDAPRDVIRQLVVDSGVPNRAHRKDLFGRAFQAVGVGCGPHAEWGSMCVIDLAGAIVRR